MNNLIQHFDDYDVYFNHVEIKLMIFESFSYKLI